MPPFAETENGTVVAFDTLKSFPVIFRPVTWMSVEPWFTSVKLEFAVCPTVTVPNSTASVEVWNDPIPVDVTE